MPHCQLWNTCAWHSWLNVECYFSLMFFDSFTSINHVAFRWKNIFRLFNVIHNWIFGLANALFNHSWWCRVASVLKFGHQPPYYFVYTSSEGSDKSTHTYEPSLLNTATSTKIKMGLFLWYVLYVNLFCLIWTMQKLLLGNDFVPTIMFTFDMLNINLILSVSKFHCKTNRSNW